MHYTLDRANIRRDYPVHMHSKAIGVGEYAAVYACGDLVHTPPHQFVAKVLRLKGDRMWAAYHTEQKVFEMLAKHPPHAHIIQYVGSYITNGLGVLILERFQGTTLHAHLTKAGRMGPKDMTHALRQIVSAMDWLHKQNIALCDLKPENIAYDQQTRTCRLFDFGLAAVLPKTGAHTSDGKGTPYYMAPEVLLRQARDPMKSDYWALGQVVFEMLTGQRMYGFCTALDELRGCVLAKDMRARCVRASIPLNEQALIMGLCAYKPGKRWTLQRVRDWLFAQEGDAMDVCA